MSIDRSTEVNTLADVTPEERERYLAWWRKFKMLDRASWLGGGLVLGSYFLSLHYSADDWGRLGVIGVGLFLMTRVWIRVLNCPRCGATYSGGLITVINRFSFLDKCYGCDLSRRELAALERRGY